MHPVLKGKRQSKKEELLTKGYNIGFNDCLKQIRKALHQEYGFGDKRIDRLEDRLIANMKIKEWEK